MERVSAIDFLKNFWAEFAKKPPFFTNWPRARLKRRAKTMSDRAPRQNLAQFAKLLFADSHLLQDFMIEPPAYFSAGMNRYRSGTPILMLPSGVTTFLPGENEAKSFGSAHQLLRLSGHERR